MIEKGTYKVVWISKDTSKIYSKMFENVDHAKVYGKWKKDYLIFRLVKHRNHVEYTWTLMPYGNYKLYEMALKFYTKHKGKRAVIEKIIGM